MSTDDLIELRARGTLTPLALSVLEGELDSRGVDSAKRVELTQREQQRAPGKGRHIIVANVHRFLGAFYGALAGIMLMIAVYNLVQVFVLGPRALPQLGAALAVSVMIGLIAALHLVVSRGAREKKQWARTASILIAVLLLFAIPIGTIVAIILFANAGRSWDEIEVPVDAGSSSNATARSSS